MTAPLILIDGSSYFFRAFHALPPLTTSKGKPTGAIYGVANMVKRLLKDYKPEQIAVVFDAKGKTFRDEWYPEYKAHRAPMPEDLHCQFKPLLNLLEAMGLPILMIEGVEADDVIGTLAQQATAEKKAVIISTSDKDFAQLVNEHVTLINTMSNQILNMQTVQEKFGVSAQQIIDYLTLVGDTVDNIPGVSKCGPKTAAKWLQEYHSLDNLMTHADKITGKIGEYLRASLAHLPLSKRLVTIKTDVNLPLSLQDLKAKKANRALLIDLTKEMEFKGWLKELLSEEEIAAAKEPSPLLPFAIINTEQALSSFLAKLKASSSFCLAMETTGPIDNELVGLALAIENEAAYLPLGHLEAKNQLPKELILTSLKPIFENSQIKKIGHDLKKDYLILKQHGIQLKGISFDTMLASYVINSSASNHDKQTLALKYLGHKILSLEDVVGKGAKQLSFATVALEKAGLYLAGGAAISLKLQPVLLSLMDESLKSVFNEIEIPLLSVLAEMEYHGVLIDETILLKHGSRLRKRMLEVEQESITLASKPFNLNSPKQLQEILFNELKLPVFNKTPTGQPSTAEAVLQELAFDYRLPAVILEYRSLSKLVSTYIEALPKCIHPLTKRVHTCFNQAIAATGRLSSSDPNLQNIPIRNEEGRLIRKAFIAPPNHLLLAADYSQIELRIMAHLSKDENLVTAFRKGLDIHAATASEIFHVPLDKVTPEQRRRSKAINFGLIYGMSSFGLAKQLGIDKQDAQQYMESYFKRYPGVLQYMDSTRRQAHQQGYVETLYGRRLYLPEINTQNLVRQKAAERMAINAPMQGTAADIIKKAMLAIARWQTGLSPTYARMVMQVHDELIFEVDSDFIETASQSIRELMENAVTLSVPLQVSIGIGQDWDEAH